MISKLSIFHKMLIPPLFAIALFGLYILNIYKEQFISKKYIESIQNNHFPIMKITNENKFLLDNITKSFKDAVGAQEKEWLSDAIIYKENLSKNLKKLLEFDINKNILNKMSFSFENYFKTAMKLSIALIDSDKNSHNIELLTQKMTDSLKQTKSSFKMFNISQNEAFTNTISNTKKHQIEIFDLGLRMGIFSLVIIIFITLYLSLITNKSIKELLESFKNIADGNPDFSKRLEEKSSDELGELAKQFNRFTKKLEKDYNELTIAKQNAEKANIVKSEFLANMSHEIRTPLNAVIGFSELLAKSNITSKQSSYLKSITNGGETLLALVNDILDLSKIESGKLQIQNQSLNIRNVVNDIKMMFIQKAKEKDLKLILNFSKNVPEYIVLDEIRVKQILLNIIGNAIKFTKEGYIQIDIKTSNFDEDSNLINLEIYVKDTGIGIAKDQQEKIFDNFVQQEGQSNREYGGTGLGLAICKKLLNLMNGTITLNSTEKIGSTFLITFEKVEVSKKFEKNIKEQEVSTVADFEEATILLVDDIEINRSLIINLLNHTKLKIYEASNGKEAIEKSKKLKPDLILMDLKMPVMGGWEATKIIKEDKILNSIPIIALSASARGMEDENIKKLFDGYITKPLDFALLIKELSSFLAHSKVEKKLLKKIEHKLLDNTDEIENIFKINFDENLKNSWQKALKGFSFEDTLEFVNTLNIFAKKHKQEILIEFSHELKQSVEDFDITKMENKMNEISNILKKAY